MSTEIDPKDIKPGDTVHFTEVSGPIQVRRNYLADRIIDAYLYEGPNPGGTRTWYLDDRPWEEPPVGSIVADPRTSYVYVRSSAGWSRRSHNESVAVSSENVRVAMQVGYQVIRRGYDGV